MRKIVLSAPPANIVQISDIEPNVNKYYAYVHDSGSVGLLTARKCNVGPYFFACMTSEFTLGNYMTNGSGNGEDAPTPKEAIRNALLDPSVKVIEFDSFLEFTKWYAARA